MKKKNREIKYIYRIYTTTDSWLIGIYGLCDRTSSHNEKLCDMVYTLIMAKVSHNSLMYALQHTQTAIFDRHSVKF